VASCKVGRSTSVPAGNEPCGEPNWQRHSSKTAHAGTGQEPSCLPLCAVHHMLKPPSPQHFFHLLSHVLSCKCTGQLPPGTPVVHNLPTLQLHHCSSFNVMAPSSTAHLCPENKALYCVSEVFQSRPIKLMRGKERLYFINQARWSCGLQTQGVVSR
jgi:hypothetical protein